MPTSPELNFFLNYDISLLKSLLKSSKLNLETFKLEMVQHLGSLYHR